MLELKNIVKDYQTGNSSVRALKGVSLQFKRDEFVSILGPSGCGKTTLLNIVGGLDRYTEGDLIINGKSTKHFSDADWDAYRNVAIGFVFQTYNLISHLSVLDNVAISLSLSGVGTAERRERALKALDDVGLSDKVDKRPNQLSGGQMQRVAIARALVNNPKILLADEPTGALDSATSIQVMELLKKISHDRLVIMVTHNPELASQYSDRIVRMKDGVVTEDTRPYQGADQSTLGQAGGAGVMAFKRTSMSYPTAIKSSFKNLMTKKGRTIITSIAGSIGIIGIALILALTSGLSGYIDKMQKDMVSSNPIVIQETALNMDAVMSIKSKRGKTTLEKFPSVNKIFVEKAMSQADFFTQNVITEKYIKYLKDNLSKDLYYDMTFKTGMRFNVFKQYPGQDDYTRLNTSGFNMLLDDEFVKTQYDKIAGDRFPTAINEVALIVSDTNEITDRLLNSIGLRNGDDDTVSYNFSEIIGQKYVLLNNDACFTKTTNDKGTEYYKWISDNAQRKASKEKIEALGDRARTLEIVCILRVNDKTDGGAISNGLAYRKELYAALQAENLESEIVTHMLEKEDDYKIALVAYQQALVAYQQALALYEKAVVEGDASAVAPTAPTVPVIINPTTGYAYDTTNSSGLSVLLQAYSDLRSFGGVAIPNEISIYPKSVDAKNAIKKVLADWNKTEEGQKSPVAYTDMSEILVQALQQMVDVISYVLIGFTAISLVVSSIMIGIITYVSVIERTKEIGIMRSVGARKKDISRIFNAEAIIIGFAAGLIGILIALILTIPINLIVAGAVGVKGIAKMTIWHVLELIGLSTALTLVAGLFPAAFAAKKDPVVALRTE